jgi:hypothetical protein
MSKSAAERQAAYRARRAFAGPQGDGERRISTWISTAATFALARLAHRYGVTQRAMLERLLIGEDERILSSLASDDAAWNAYLNREPLRGNEPGQHAGSAGSKGKQARS